MVLWFSTSKSSSLVSSLSLTIFLRVHGRELHDVRGRGTVVTCVVAEIVLSTATQPIRLGGGYTVALAPNFKGRAPKTVAVSARHSCASGNGRCEWRAASASKSTGLRRDVADVPVATPQKSETARGKEQESQDSSWGQVRRWPQNPPTLTLCFLSVVSSHSSR